MIQRSAPDPEPTAKRPRGIPRIIVQESRHGQGVYATREIEADDEVGRIRGRLTLDEGFDPRYCMEMDNDLYMIPRSPYRFLNHSCDPNCELFMYDDEEIEEDTNTRPLYLGSLRDIAAGEELTIDYQWPAYFAIPCHCGADECRGWIVDLEELDLIPQEHPDAS